MYVRVAEGMIQQGDLRCCSRCDQDMDGAQCEWSVK